MSTGGFYQKPTFTLDQPPFQPVEAIAVWRGIIAA
jgi:hypothetical protein